VIGFQTFGYRQNFLGAAYRVLGLEVTTGVLAYAGRQVVSGIYPIGVDPAPFLEALQADPATATELRQLEESVGQRKLLLGMDRLDYSKYKSPQKGGGNHAALAIGLSHLAITFATDFVDH
jgi:trehalose-6-phosphate synthase